MRQKYQEKIIDSRAQNEPRKIFDIVNSVGGNSINSTTRTSISILSDTSGTLKIPLTFWFIVREKLLFLKSKKIRQALKTKKI